MSEFVHSPAGAADPDARQAQAERRALQARGRGRDGVRDRHHQLGRADLLRPADAAHAGHAADPGAVGRPAARPGLGARATSGTPTRWPSSAASARTPASSTRSRRTRTAGPRPRSACCASSTTCRRRRSAPTSTRATASPAATCRRSTCACSATASSTATSPTTTAPRTRTGGPAAGKIDWAQTLVALKEVGFDGVISIELEDVPDRANRNMVTAGPRFDYENTESVALPERAGRR